jgi:hypothetical protein
MNNDKDTAIKTKNKIKEIFENNKLNTNIKFDLAYNYDNILPTELLEAYQQKQGENLTLYWEWISKWSLAPDWFKNIVEEFLISYNENILSYSNTEEQIAFYKDLLRQKARILTIAHSQGNLFTNDAFKELDRIMEIKNRVVMLSVATPASFVFNNGAYFTLESDLVINTVRLAAKKFKFQEPLTANTINTLPKSGVINHSFIEYYLNATPTGEKIINASIEAINKLNDDKKVKEEIFKHIGKRCLEWWNNLSINKIEVNECLSQCTTARVGMGSFDCLNTCKYLCKCYDKSLNDYLK